MTNEMEFCIFTTFYYPLDMGILAHRRNYVPYQKLLTYDDPALVLSGLKDEREYNTHFRPTF